MRNRLPDQSGVDTGTCHRLDRQRNHESTGQSSDQTDHRHTSLHPYGKSPRQHEQNNRNESGDRSIADGYQMTHLPLAAYSTLRRRQSTFSYLIHHSY